MGGAIDIHVHVCWEGELVICTYMYMCVGERGVSDVHVYVHVCWQWVVVSAPDPFLARIKKGEGKQG